jgi:hypothetical protein
LKSEFPLDISMEQSKSWLHFARCTKEGKPGFFVHCFFLWGTNERTFIAKKGVTEKQGAQAYTQPVNLADEALMRPMEAPSNEICRSNANYVMFSAAPRQNEQNAPACQQEIDQQPFSNRLMLVMISYNKASHDFLNLVQ